MPIVGRVKRSVAERLHPEVFADNVSVDDCDLAFFQFIRAIMLRHTPSDVLDYGAGRNQYVQDFDPAQRSFLIRDLRDLRFGGARVVACDIADAVLTHPTSDQQLILSADGTLDQPDASFDLIVSDYVFEHVEQPAVVAGELQRLLRPGGWLVVRTPNSWGYLRLASSLVPNRLHDAVLRRVQPHRKAVDTFPTYYRLNSLSAMRRYFNQCRVEKITDSWEPAYFFGSPLLYRLMRLMHRIMPRAMGTAHIFIARKAAGD